MSSRRDFLKNGAVAGVASVASVAGLGHLAAVDQSTSESLGSFYCTGIILYGGRATVLLSGPKGSSATFVLPDGRGIFQAHDTYTLTVNAE